MTSDIYRLAFLRNPLSWFETFGRIFSKKVGVDHAKDAPTANWLQKRVGEVVAWCLENNVAIRLILYKPRQRGCSTVSSAIAYVLGRGTTMRWLVMGGQDSQSDNLWKQLSFYQQHDGFDGWGNEARFTVKKGSVSNGTIYERETAGDANAGRSGTYHGIIITEPARWPSDGKKNAADVFNSVLPCCPKDEPGTCIIMESTADGPVGIFPESWEAARDFEDFKEGDRGSGFIRIFAPWFVFSDMRKAYMSPAEKEGLRAKLTAAKDTKAIKVWDEYGLEPEQVLFFHELLLAPECSGDPIKRDKEYPSSVEDGFQSSGASRFDYDALNAMDAIAAQEKDKLQFGRFEVVDPLRPNDISFVPCDPKQSTWCISEPVTDGYSYFLSSDNMTGASHVKGADPDCNSVVCWRRGFFGERGKWFPDEIVGTTIGLKGQENRVDADQLAELIRRAAVYYGHTMVAPERNRGEWLIAELRKRRVLIWERERPPSEIENFEGEGEYGWQTDKNSKPFMVDELARRIRNHNLKGQGMRCIFPWILREYRTFVTHEDGSTGAMKVKGCHDDYVIGSGIGACLISNARVYRAPRALYPTAWDIREGGGVNNVRGVW